jgi:ribosomal protein S18 acetylase RimI-like enzyme
MGHPIKITAPTESEGEIHFMNIRSYQPGDEKAVIRLWKACGLIVPHNNPVRDIQRKLKVKPEWFLVGTKGEQVIASCMAGYEGHRGWINYLAVAPAEQGRGHATEIMAAAEKLLRKAGCPKINLQIRAGNDKVIAFYQHIGFTKDKVISMGKRLEPDES